MSDFEYEESDGTAGVSGIVITKYSKEAPKDVIIPAEIDGKKVTGIGKRAFSRTKLTSLTIPEGVTFIGDNAFSYHELTSVKIPDSVKSIGEEAFRAGTLSSVIIGNGVETIGKEAFSCNRISELVLGENLITIGEQAFSNNKNNNLETVIIPDSVQGISKKAFSEAGIKNLTIGNNVKTIEEQAFAKNQIAQIIFGNSATEVAIETIGEYAFYENKLTELVIPKSVKSIGDSAFRINPFKAVVLPENADYGNTTDKIFGARVTYLSEAAHSWEKDNTQYANPDDFKWRKTKDGKAIIIFSYLGKENEGSSLEVNIPPQIQGLPVIEVCFTDGVKKQNRIKIKHVTIPDSVITISNNAFEGHGLGSVIIGKGVKTIQKRAFAGNLLTEVIIPDTVTFIGSSAFINNKLKHITIPKGITFVSVTVFAENELTSVTLHERLISIEDGAFMDNKIDSLTIPQSVKSIREDAFENNKIKSIIIPDRITHLGEAVFRKNKIAELTIGKALRIIPQRGFEDNKLTEITIPAAIKVIGNAKIASGSYNADGLSFYKNKITSIDLPEGVLVRPYSFTNNQIKSVIRPKYADFRWDMPDRGAKGDGTPTDGFGPFDRGVTITNADDESKRVYPQVKPFFYPPKHESLQKLDNELNCSIADAKFTAKDIKPNRGVTPDKNDLILAYNNYAANLNSFGLLRMYRASVKEVTPAGNWKWELEAENNESIAVIICWNSEKDADRAEETYKSTPGIVSRRFGNATAYVRTSIELGSVLDILSPFTNTGQGMKPKPLIIKGYL